MITKSDFGSIAKVYSFSPIKRPGLDKLIMLISEISDNGLERLAGFTESAPAKYPRNPHKISVATQGFSATALESLRAAELCSTAGLNQILKRATELAAQHPRRAKTSACVLNIKRK